MKVWIITESFLNDTIRIVTVALTQKAAENALLDILKNIVSVSKNKAILKFSGEQQGTPNYCLKGPFDVVEA